MKKQLTLLILTVFYLNAFSQIEFEKGYFIDNNGNRTDCLIKNLDWKNSPDKFRYKLTEADEAEVRTIDETSEFSVGALHYIKATVKLDRSSDKERKLENGKYPKFKEETIFLNLLVEGTANLYQYSDGSLQRFFFKMNDSSIEPLIYKRYLVGTKHIAKNEEYQNQLKSALICADISERQIENLSYLKNALTKIFIKFNQCVNPNFIDKQAENPKRKALNIYIKPGINISSLYLEHSLAKEIRTQFDKKAGFRGGLEVEYIMPFNKNKWGVFVEPSFRSYHTEKMIGSRLFSPEYQSVEIAVGLRHYFYIGDNSSISISLFGIRDIPFNSSVQISSLLGTGPPPIQLTTDTGNLGIGYTFKNKFVFELRYGQSRDLLPDNSTWNSDYRYLGVILGYNILGGKKK